MLVISQLGKRAREWALTSGTSVDAAFFTWDKLKLELSRVFALPNQAYRTRSSFLASRHGKRELGDYVQDLQTLIAGMAADPLFEVATVSLDGGTPTGVAQTHVLRTHPISFESAVGEAWNA